MQLHAPGAGVVKSQEATLHAFARVQRVRSQVHGLPAHVGGLPSIQTSPAPVQKGVPLMQVLAVPEQWSFTVQFRLSVQLVVDGAKASAGQAALVPVQVSATSHTPADARHTVVFGLKAFTGQSALVPVQVSATSHTPAAGRQTVPALSGTLLHSLHPLTTMQISLVQGLLSLQLVA